MSPKIFRGQQESGSSSGLGRFVYLADARFLPHGETRMHAHREIDVISVMVEGRIQHEGSLEHGRELQVDDIQVQRAGGEEFTHNEINPDDDKNRMIQLWVLPETPGGPADYKLYQSRPDERLRIYGGPDDQDETFPAKTVIEIAQVKAGDSLAQPAQSLVYITTGTGTSNEEVLREGDLVETINFTFTATRDSKLIVVYQE
jgi:redox-sensitive bicupin YhaK (pirin superfamily)